MQHAVQLQRDVGVLGGVSRGLLEGDLVERDLLRALAGDVLVLDRVDAEVELRAGVHVVARRGRVQARTTRASSRSACRQGRCRRCEDVRVVLEVVADLRRVSRPRAAACSFASTSSSVQLVRRARVVVREREVGGLAGLDAEGDADDFGLHVVEAGRLGVEGEERRFVERVEPCVECCFGRGYRLVLDVRARERAPAAGTSARSLRRT